jgi:hypothetical protein
LLLWHPFDPTTKVGRGRGHRNKECTTDAMARPVKKQRRGRTRHDRPPAAATVNGRAFEALQGEVLVPRCRGAESIYQ